jgi:predicted transcriptional regulator
MLEQERKDERATQEISVRFSDDAYQQLEEIAERTGKSIPEILRDAIALEKWYEDAIRGGARVLVERDNGQLHELVRP